MTTLNHSTKIAKSVSPAKPVKRLLFAALIASCAMGLAACGDKVDKGANAPTDKAAAAPANLNDVKSPQAAQQLQKQMVQDSLPKADPATPDASYAELNSGNQLMFSYLALADLPVDYDQVARRMSRDYANSNDEFRKHDLLDALKPKIDGSVSQAKTQRYFRMTINNGIRQYAFDKKAFPLDSSLSEAGSYRYFLDNGDYRLSFSNGERFHDLSVQDENAARKIESMRARGEAPNLVVYAFAQSADIANKAVSAQIVKVTLVDRQGNVLASQ
ncbi:DUF4852 domain-containing protein [Pandoraea sp. PE-S2R-1]|uniref:DUF4852 domain-containing protein n=1 Tax=Pandoraea sp. PE-S2R-1 TaxID=1986994 RepID=UPI000B3F8996|nr:DUF4852 domain-containing protein [Pandoraea sp. PE-S2R-1]